MKITLFATVDWDNQSVTALEDIADSLDAMFANLTPDITIKSLSTHNAWYAPNTTNNESGGNA